MKKFFVLLCAIGGLAAFAADIPVNPAQFDDLQGKVHRGNLGRTGVFNATGIAGAPAQRWKFQTGGPVKSSPVVVDGVAYFGSHDGAVYAVNAASGALIWSSQTGGKVSGSAAVVSNTVFIASESGRLYAFNAVTGATNWSVQIESGKVPAGSPAVAYGAVIIPAGAQYGHRAVSMTTGYIYAYDMSTGAQIWKSAASGIQAMGSPALNASNFYGSYGASGSYGAFRISNGTVLWQRNLGHQARQYGSSMAGSNKVYMIGSIRGSVSRHPSGASTPDWQETTLDQNLEMEMNNGGLFGYEIISDPALAHGRIYAGCSDGKLYTFDEATGAKGWSFQTGGKVMSGPAVAGGLVYFGSWDGRVYAVNATNGSEVWNCDLGERVVSSPWPADGALYIGCDDGALYCLEEQSDTDADGLPDWWETLYFGSATAADPAATAANGINTLLECYTLGLDPTDPLAGRPVAAAVALTVTTNRLAEEVKPFGLNFGDSYYSSPSLKVRDAKNFEGTVYRQAIRGILTTNSLISYYGSSNSLSSSGWLSLYTASGTVFKVISGPDRGLTGAISGVSFQWVDVWNNGGSNLVPVFALNRPVDLGTNSSVRDMAILVENMTRTGEGWIGSTNDYWGSGDITPVNDNPPGVFGSSCARMNGTVTAAQFKFATLYPELGDVDGDWNFHFWIKTDAGSPVINVKTVSDNAKFTTNLTPSASWQKVELTIPVVNKGLHPLFQITVSNGAARIDHVQTWKSSDTNSTAFRDDFVNALRELNAGVLRQVYMSGNTVSNWIYDPVDRQAGLFRTDKTVGPYGTSRDDPPAGFHSLMELCEELGAEPWLCLPGAIHPEEVAFFVDYLGGPTNTAGGKIRADLGHPVPWTQTLKNIHLEFGNEAWNSLSWYNFAGFNGADYWRELISAGKGSASYTGNIKFHAAGQNFSSSMTGRILNDATNADNYAIATYMIHNVKAGDNWVFDQGDYEAQFKWFMAYPMHKVYEDGMPQQMSALQDAAASAEFSQYEFNYHAADFDLADPDYTNVMNDVNVFLPSIGHGISVANTMLAELKECRMRTQCFFNDTSETSYDGGRLFGAMHSYKPGSERYRPVFYALAMANKALHGDMVQTAFASNGQFSAYGVFSDDVPETRSYDTLYSYAFRNGTTNSLVLFNYDMDAVRPVTVDLPDYVKDSAAVEWTLFTPVYTNNNEPGPAGSSVLPETTNIAFSSGTEIILAPFSMKVIQWESEGLLPHITASTSGLTVPENGTAGFTLRLSSLPSGPVTVTVARVSGDSDLAPLTTGLIFTTGNWNQEQTVTVQAADDADYTNGTAVIRCSAGNLAPVDITATEQENDIQAEFLLPFTETFDPGSDMADIPGNLAGQHGWIVEGSGGATVQSNEAFAGTQAAALSKTTAAHSFSNGPDIVNITFYAKPSSGPAPLAIEQDGWSAVFYINSNRYTVAYSNQTPVTVQTVQASNGWNRFDVSCNYSSQTWGLELNGITLFTRFTFYSSRPQFSRIAFRDSTGSTTTYVDSVYIRAGEDPDSDSDGLPDAWEQEHFGGLHVNPDDPAANGINTVLGCYIAGLDPTDPDARFTLIALTPSGANSVLFWQGISGRVYTVYWTSNLLSGFQTLETNVPWTGGVFTDSVHGAEAQGFYKIEVKKE